MQLDLHDLTGLVAAPDDLHRSALHDGVVQQLDLGLEDRSIPDVDRQRLGFPGSERIRIRGDEPRDVDMRPGCRDPHIYARRPAGDLRRSDDGVALEDIYLTGSPLWAHLRREAA